MSDAKSRLSGLLGHFVGVPQAQVDQRPNFHTLSPTFFLPRAAAIEPEVNYTIELLLLYMLEMTNETGPSNLSRHQEQ